VLVRLDMATEHQIAKTLAHQLGFPYVSLPENPSEPSVATLVPKALSSSPPALPGASRRTC
jgi:Type II secretion system (T2SS), protein E, N-terminal domain